MAANPDTLEGDALSLALAELLGEPTTWERFNCLNCGGAHPDLEYGERIMCKGEIAVFAPYPDYARNLSATFAVADELQYRGWGSPVLFHRGDPQQPHRVRVSRIGASGGKWTGADATGSDLATAMVRVLVKILRYENTLPKVKLKSFPASLGTVIAKETREFLGEQEEPNAAD